MKNQRSRIPRFKTEAEEANFWDTHDVTNFLEELRPVNLQVRKPQRRLISLRLDERQIRCLKRIAASKDIGYQTLIRMWIAEHLNELRKAA